MQKNILSEDDKKWIQKLFLKHKISEELHKASLGSSPSIKSCIGFNNKRIVLIGGSLIACDDPLYDWECPADFLVSYLKTRLGDVWFNEEVIKLENDRHEIIKWYFNGRTNIDKTLKLRWFKLNGKALSILHLSYDLFVLDSKNNMPFLLINRLKNPDNNFNGARYEAFVFSTLVRAGFEIEYNDEQSGINGRVAECRAKHIQTGEYISVEAKTRNIRGILGATKGNRNKISLYDKLRDAIDKNVNDPYVIFIDTNFPELDFMKDDEKIKKIISEFNKLKKYRADNLPNLICITNISFHYGKNESLPADCAFGFIVVENSKIPFKNQDLIVSSIVDSINKYNYFPSEFNESEGHADKIIEQLDFG